MFQITADELPRFMACNGSRLMPDVRPPREDDDSVRKEGIAAHWLATAVFEGRHTVMEMIDRKTPNGVYITNEIAEHVEWYLEGVDTPYGEMEVDTSFGSDVWRVNGRADHVAWFPQVSHLRIGDFKYGWRLVEPEMNWTLIAHAIGYCLKHQISPSVIMFVIHQPRPNHRDGKRREWSISWQQLLDLYSQLTAVMLNPSDELRTGPHCHKCPAVATCPAASKAAYNAIDASDMAHSEEIDDTQLAYELDLMNRAEAIIKSRKEALEEVGKYRIERGSVIKGYGVENQLTNRDWKAGIDASVIKALTGIDASKPGLVTPAQAERLGVPEMITESLCERRLKGRKLVRIDANKKATKMFGAK